MSLQLAWYQLLERIRLLNVENVNVVRTVFVIYVDNSVVKQILQVNDFVRKAYYAFFDMKLGDQDKARVHTLSSKLVLKLFVSEQKELKKFDLEFQ